VKKVGLQQMSVQCIVETRESDKATLNAGDSVAKFQERTAAICDVGLQTVQEMK
jgi:hypothetical protein